MNLVESNMNGSDMCVNTLDGRFVVNVLMVCVYWCKLSEIDALKYDICFLNV